MPQITPNTQIDTINILNEAASVNDTDLLFLQRGATSYRVRKSNFIIPPSQINPINDLTVLGNASGVTAAPSELSIATSLSSVSDNHDELASSKAIKDYIETNAASSPDRISNTYNKDVVYQNTRNRKLLVLAIVDGGNDIYGFAAHVSSVQADVSSATSAANSTGRDKYTCKAYEFHVSDGTAPDITTLIFVVPPTHYFKMTGDAVIRRVESYEI